MPPVEEAWFGKLTKIDFSKPIDAKATHGFLKRSPDYSTNPPNKIWRLYLTLDLDDYIEFDEDKDYLGSVELEHPQYNPLGGTLVYLRASTELRRVSTASRRAQADLLHGKLRSEYQSRTGIEALGAISPKKVQPPTGMDCTQVTYCQC